MSLQSMTGFGRSSGEAGSWRWGWEVRSVNSRGLDVRLRLPSGFETLEQAARKAVSNYFRRGSIAVTLTASREAGNVEVRVNETILAQLLEASKRVQSLTGGAAPSVDGLLALKGVLEVAESKDSEDAALSAQQVIEAGLSTALEEAVAARGAEGLRLEAIVSEKIDDIDRLTRQATNSPGRHPDKVKARLKDLVGRLTETGHDFDEARLHQEAVMIATKADIEEEVKRLAAHVAAARGLLSETGPVGRKLDFLAQEFNREANTLCSKAGDSDISSIGLALKAAIDQMREQVQNIE